MNSDPHFQHLVGILGRRRWLILSVTAFGMLLAGTGAMLLPARYTAKVQLLFEPQQTARIGELPGLLTQNAEDAAIQTQVATLLSFGTRERIRLSLPDDAAYRAAFEKQANAHPGRATVLQSLRETWASFTAMLPLWAQPAPSAPEPAGSATDPSAVRPPDAEEFERRLKVFQESGSHVIAATYTASAPELAAAVANRVAEAHIEAQTEQKRVASSRELAWLDSRIPTLRTEVDRAELAIRDYEAIRGYKNVGSTPANDQAFAELSRQVAAAELETASRQGRLDFVRDRLRGPGAAAVETLNSPVLSDLHRQETTLLQSEAELAITVGDQHPRFLQVRNQLQQIRARIGQESEFATRNLANDVATSAAQLALLRTRLAGLNEAMADEHLRDLDHDITVKRQLLTSLVQRREEVRGQQDILRSDTRILSLAALPERPSSPRALLFVFPAMVACLIAASMLAVLLDQLDRKLRSQRELTAALDIPCLALVPKLRGIRRRRPHQYLLAKPLAAYTEAIRSLVASLHLTGAGRQIVLVSSSVPGEGKTTVAVSLAAYMASLGRSVLLVDLDFRNSTVLRELGGQAEGGVLDLIVHGRSNAEVIQHLPGLGLDYLPVSRRPHDPFALFATHEMSSLLRQMREQYDCVVVDSPPLLAITEARLLAAMVDKILFVVKWGSTRRELAQNALSLLRSFGRDTVTGAVMTQVDLKKHARGRYGDVGEAFVRYKDYYLNG